jgi:hypothetical protein
MVQKYAIMSNNNVLPVITATMQKTTKLNYVAYGGGLNSTAMILLMIKTQQKPDLIVFADTGGEREDTYGYIRYFNKYLNSKYSLNIETIKKKGETLENESLRSQTLPSLAYGFKRCSLKYKRAPQDKFRNNNDLCRAVWAGGGKVNVYIGYDADEAYRADKTPLDDKKYQYHYPLINNDIGRDECVEIIKDANLNIPEKSSCFFCPAMKISEILALNRNHKLLMDRALAIEKNAKPNLKTVKGLGRNFSWANIVSQENFEFTYPAEIPCECYDG